MWFAETTNINKLQVIQSAALRIWLGCPKAIPISAMEIDFGVKRLDLNIKRQI